MILGISSFVSLCVLEIACRMLGFAPVAEEVPKDTSKLHSAPFIRTAQENGWMYWPLEEQTIDVSDSSDGSGEQQVKLFRNRCSFREDAQETPIKKTANTYRIMVAGDSHTDGVVENKNSYANLLERDLNAASSDRMTYDVINAGHTAFSPYQELWLYEKVLNKFEPDLLVVGFYAGNDVWELMTTDRVHLAKTSDGWVHQESDAKSSDGGDKPSGLLGHTKHFLREHFGTYHALASIGFLRSRVGTADEPSLFDQEIAQMAQESPPIYWQSYGQAHYFREHPKDWEVATSKLRFTLKRFQEEARTTQTPIMFVLIPTLHQTCPDVARKQFDQAAKTLRLTPENTRTDDRACELFLGLAQEIGIETIDMRPDFREFRQQHPSEQLYWQFDHHLNPAGHRVVADRLYQRLQDKPFDADALGKQVPEQR
ncbi:alginate O-acetyltransferase AlgX-related protein [Stieleria marina]|uniref:alginate O-acetyltransferase AlgX-related protein n=1 Tax=Stieleria marina TaxID=1930275 RepID=UPI003AF3E580